MFPSRVITGSDRVPTHRIGTRHADVVDLCSHEPSDDDGRGGGGVGGRLRAPAKEAADRA
ncbi:MULTISPECIES: hypothetical protein [Actinoalloteichus]|uniref:hypothetical protein n=1 Tax=Actinoalloteichus TaxID=65496 RepID=UPI0012F775FA|nr:MULTISPECIES: hypothetical protein [Actinoalloteichus]